MRSETFSFLAKVMPSRYVEIWRFRCCGMINNQQDRVVEMGEDIGGRSNQIDETSHCEEEWYYVDDANLCKDRMQKDVVSQQIRME